MTDITFVVKMATTGVGFRWLDILEKEFDKACVELDTSLAELEGEEPDVVCGARQKIATLSSCFAQLAHKALTIFQNSAKLEAELVDMRAELVQARAAAAANGLESGEMLTCVPEGARARIEATQLARENAALRETVLALHSELFGARLATKYLDKELAGRIQQLQLLGRDMRAELRDSLWAQVEAEILLQRHKTLVRVCRGVSPRPAPPAPPRARPRTVTVRRKLHQGLGISVTGGREHGVPILISELEADGPAALTGDLYVGDAILAINDVDLTQACHKEAVQALQSVKGDCALCVQFIATDDDDRLSEDNYRFPLYPEEGDTFGGEAGGGGATPTAPRTPDYHSREVSEAGSVEECSGTAYPDYNNINNNLAILDMDDDNIKIEARLEMVPPECNAAVGARRRCRGPYVCVRGDSSGDSATPVHRRARRRAQSRPKGYAPVRSTLHTDDDDDDSADEHDRSAEDAEDALAEPEPDRSVALPVQLTSTAVQSAAPFEQSTQLTAMSTQSMTTAMQSTTTFTQSTTNSAESVIKFTQSTINSAVYMQSTTAPTQSTTTFTHSAAAFTQSTATFTQSTPNFTQSTTPPTQPTAGTQQMAAAATALQRIPLEVTEKVKLKVNGETKRREGKAFRIGAARRVTPPAPAPAPAPSTAALPPPAPLTNGDLARVKFTSRLIAGDGDPDFGTPV